MTLYPLQQPTDKVFSGNPIHYKWQLYPYTDLLESVFIVSTLTNVASVSNYTTLLVTVYAETSNFSGIFSNIKTIPLLPQSDGTFSVNIQTFVDAYLTYFFPRLSLSGPTPAIGQFLRFYVTYQLEVNGVTGDLTTSDTFTAYKGGISYEEFNADLFFANATLFGTPPAGLTYVTKKDVCPDEYLYLYCINPWTSPSSWRTSITALLDDGSTANYDSSLFSFTPLPGVLYVCPVGFTQLGIAALAAGHTVVSYTVTIKNADGDAVAKSPLYVLDYRKYYYRRFLLWVNSLGGVETLCLKGKTDLTADYTYTSMTKSSVNDYFDNAMLQPKETNQQPLETMRYNGYTTWIDKDYLDTLRDLFLSQVIYELQSGKLVPVKIDNANNTTQTLYSTTDQKFFLNITWVVAYFNNFYTRRNTFVLPESCPAVVVFNVVQISRSSLLIIYRLMNGYNMLKITVTVGSGDPVSYFIAGNNGIVSQGIDTITVDGTDVTVVGYTVCDQYSDPMDIGPGTTVSLSCFGNHAPVAADDFYSIYTGFTDFTPLGNVLLNDYDPDGDAFTVTAVTNVSTTAGGHITIDSSGNASYKPPTSTYTGTDTYEYTITDSFGATGTGTIHVGVGAAPGAGMVYVKKGVTGVMAGPPTTGSIVFYFYANSAGTITKNTTGLSLTINYTKTDVVSGVTTTSSLTVTASGTQMTIYTGLFNNPATSESHSIALVAGTGYTII